MASDSAAETKWRQYRQMRLFFWAVFFAAVTLFALGNGTTMLFAFLVWVAVSVAVAFWPCPLCGGRVGYIPLGPLMLLWPFGVWCTTCRRRLFRHR
jgi:hypothetical protein